MGSVTNSWGIIPIMSASTRITAADVAREAGVSMATVSYVLNQTPGQKISEATTKRVKDAAKRLGYVRNRAAQALARGDSRIVVVDISIFPRSQISDVGFQGFVSRLETSGVSVLQTWWGPEAWEQKLVDLATDTTARAVITAVPVSEDTRASLEAAGVRTISSLLSTPEQLVVPLQMAGAEQVAHLARKGHTHVLYAPEVNPELGMLNDLRGRACAHTAGELGVGLTPFAPPPDTADYPTALSRALRECPAATAIAAYNDDVALKCLSALQAHGVRVPRDIAVIGVDNLPFTANTFPPLTTIEYDYAMANLDTRVLASLIEGPGITGVTGDVRDAVSVRLVRRESA